MTHLRAAAVTLVASVWIYLLITHFWFTVGGTIAIAWTATNTTTRKRRR